MSSFIIKKECVLIVIVVGSAVTVAGFSISRFAFLASSGRYEKGYRKDQSGSEMETRLWSGRFGEMLSSRTR